jgi:hypothetical protein
MHSVEKKLREARFFLDQMRQQERRAFGDKEPFDFYLSAFLNAVRTVDYRLRHEQPATYPAWRKRWNAAHPTQDELITVMSEDRRIEVHESGSNRVMQIEEIQIGIGGSYSDPSGMLTMLGSPGPLLGIDAGGTIYMPQYVYVFAGTASPVTEVCGECLELLTQMVDQFRADHGI